MIKLLLFFLSAFDMSDEKDHETTAEQKRKSLKFT